MKKLILMALLAGLPMTAWADVGPQEDGVAFNVPFKRFAGKLGAAGTQAVTENLPALMAAERVIVQGRPDIARPRAKADLPARRAAAIKNFLVHQGIAESRISIENLEEHSASEVSGMFNATIIAVNPKPAAAPVQVPAVVADSAPAAIGGNAVVVADNATATATAAGSLDVQATAMRCMVQAAREAGFTPEDSQKMADAWMLERPAPAVTPSAAPVAEAFAAVDEPKSAPTAQSAPATDIPSVPAPAAPARLTAQRVWSLDKGKTLRTNIEDWARLAGWQAPQWMASNDYEVLFNRTFEGEFPVALREISSLAALNLCVKKSDRAIRITDSNKSCKE